jgi:hypothetical protein
MPQSTALGEFKKSIAMATELMNLERAYDNPPKKADQPVVEGLRACAKINWSNCFPTRSDGVVPFSMKVRGFYV